jgi:hypothetical protein
MMSTEAACPFEAIASAAWNAECSASSRVVNETCFRSPYVTSHSSSSRNTTKRFMCIAALGIGPLVCRWEAALLISSAAVTLTVIGAGLRPSLYRSAADPEHGSNAPETRLLTVNPCPMR